MVRELIALPRTAFLVLANDSRDFAIDSVDFCRVSIELHSNTVDFPLQRGTFRGQRPQSVTLAVDFLYDSLLCFLEICQLVLENQLLSV
jgi:hypothetical protein